MKFEMDKVREFRLAAGLPVRDTAPRHIEVAEEILGLRKNMRMLSDGLIAALMNQSTEGVAVGITQVTTAGATALVSLGIGEPGIEDLVVGAKELLEDARVIYDKGLQVGEYDQVKVGATMMTLICMGLASVLNIPYAVIFTEIFNAANEKREANVRGILVEAGLLQPEPQPQPPGEAA